MFHSILAYLKTEAVVIGIVTGVITWIGLMSNPVTSPKVLGVMVFISDWNMLWSWEWWLRMIIFGVFGFLAWWLQKRKYAKQLFAQNVEWNSRVVNLQGQLNHTQLMLAAAQVRIEVLTGRRK